MATHLELRQRVSRRLGQNLLSVNKGAGAIDDIPRTSVFWTRQMVTDWLGEAYSQLWAEMAEVDPKSLVGEPADGTYTANVHSMSIQAMLGITDDPLKLDEIRDVTGVTTGEGTLIPFMEHQDFESNPTSWEALTNRSAALGRVWTYRGFNPMRIELFPRPSAAVTLRVRYVAAEPLNPTTGTTPALRPDTADNATGDTDRPLAVPSAHHDLLVLYAVVQAKQREESDWRPEWALYEEKLDRFRQSIEDRQSQGSRNTRRSDKSEYDLGASRRALVTW